VKTEFRRIAEVDRVIHEPARLMLVTMLYAMDSADFLYLLKETGLTKGNLSSHLSRLQDAGYVQIDKTFRGRIPLTVCRLTERGRTAFFVYLEKLSRVVECVPE
jgi:DNA-binding transcriptional ArsR family regulator